MRVHLLQVWFDGHIQAGLCLQRIAAGERDPHGSNHGQISGRIDIQTVGVDGVAAVGLEREGRGQYEFPSLCRVDQSGRNRQTGRVTVSSPSQWFHSTLPVLHLEPHRPVNLLGGGAAGVVQVNRGVVQTFGR